MYFATMSLYTNSFYPNRGFVKSVKSPQLFPYDGANGFPSLTSLFKHQLRLVVLLSKYPGKAT